MNITYKNTEASQKVTTVYYCQWQSGAKEYFPTLEKAIEKAEEMYVKTPQMSNESFAYWLTQRQYIGIETTIDTPIKTVFSPIRVGLT